MSAATWSQYSQKVNKLTTHQDRSQFLETATIQHHSWVQEEEEKGAWLARQETQKTASNCRRSPGWSPGSHLHCSPHRHTEPEESCHSVSVQHDHPWTCRNHQNLHWKTHKLVTSTQILHLQAQCHHQQSLSCHLQLQYTHCSASGKQETNPLWPPWQTHTTTDTWQMWKSHECKARQPCLTAVWLSKKPHKTDISDLLKRPSLIAVPSPTYLTRVVRQIWNSCLFNMWFPIHLCYALMHKNLILNAQSFNICDFMPPSVGVGPLEFRTIHSGQYLQSQCIVSQDTVFWFVFKCEEYKFEEITRPAAPHLGDKLYVERRTLAAYPCFLLPKLELRRHF